MKGKSASVVTSSTGMPHSPGLARRRISAFASPVSPRDTLSRSCMAREVLNTYTFSISATRSMDLISGSLPPQVTYRSSRFSYRAGSFARA